LRGIAKGTAPIRPTNQTVECVHELFERHAARTPEAIAISFEGERLTYGELNRRANRLAHHLRTLGVGPESVVGVALDRSPELVVGLLAILKAGGAYVPIDPDYPQARIAFMLDDAGTPLVLVRGGASSLVARGRRAVDVDAVLLATDAASDENPKRTVGPRNLVYIIYTSGSTGKPKGVPIEHRSLSNLLLSMRSEPGMTESDALVAVTSVSFDMSAVELYLPLITGARLVLASAAVSRDADRLANLITTSHATVMQATPTTWQMLLAAGWRGHPDLTILCGGEPLSRKLATALLERGKALWNLYGPTETTVYSTGTQIRSGNEPITIGLPIANTTAFLVDEGAPSSALREVAPGVAGELCLGGLGIARGYLRRPELTREKFVEDPFGPHESGGRLYRTGDLARRLADGRIELLGRIDRQVKVRGVRIELGEIEAVLAEHPSVRECVVLGQPGPTGATRLVAYLSMASLPERDTASESTRKWQKVWSEAYRTAAGADEAVFRAAGWVDIATGLQMSEEEVDERADQSAARILALEPKRVLEIGCGNGMVLRRVAPHCSSYLGLDIAPEAAARLLRELRADPKWAHVEVRQGSADDIDSLPHGTFDCIVIDSVVQYFPDIDYAARVFESSLHLLSPGGSLFVGDVRSLPLLEAFHASVELAGASNSLTTHELVQRIREGIHRERELVIDPSFFGAFARARAKTSGGAHVSEFHVCLKRSAHLNELSKFRYDVVLTNGRHGSSVRAQDDVTVTDWQESSLSLDGLLLWLDRQTKDTFAVTGIPNARVTGELAALEQLARSDGPETVGALKQALRGKGLMAVDPERLSVLAEERGFDVDLRWSEKPGSFDALFSRGARAARTVAAFTSLVRGTEAPPETSSTLTWESYANDPWRVTSSHSIARTLRSFLRRELPEAMVPSQFIPIDEMPRAPGGKLDVAVLARLGAASDRRAQAPIAPRDAIERLLVEIWEDVLAVNDIGVEDDFRELGGDSLLAVEIVSRLEKVLGKDFSLAAVFQTHGLTIAKQAAILRAQEWVPKDRASVIPLRSEGARPPLFFAGTPLNLVAYLDSDQPIYEVNIPAAHRQQYAPHIVDKTIGECVEAIRGVQPRGPYFVGGNCYGALLMLEVARRLHSTDGGVGLLVLVDPDPERDVPISARVMHHLRQLEGLGIREKAWFLRRKTEGAFRVFRSMLASRSKAMAEYEGLYNARWAKDSWREPFQTALFLTRSQFAQEHDNPHRHWSKRAHRGVTVVELMGDRVTAFSEPHIRVAGARISHCLNAAQSSSRATQEDARSEATAGNVVGHSVMAEPQARATDDRSRRPAP
jgi:amino acid adenylation domain-containing protein